MENANDGMIIAMKDQDAMEALLADLEIPDDETIEAIEAVEELEAIEAVEELEAIASKAEIEAQAVAGLEAELVKAEIYEEAEVGSEIVDNIETKAEVEAVPAADKPKRERKKASSAATSKSEAIERNLNALPYEAFQVKIGGVAEEINKTTLLSLRPTQKKIAEKFDDLIIKLHAGRKPSSYTVDCFEILDKSATPMTSKNLIAEMVAKGHAPSTANSQVGQMMVLFTVLGIASRENQTLTLHSDSAFAAKLRKFV